MSATFPELLTLSARRYLGQDVQVACLQPLSGGASSRTWAFDVETASGTDALILQLAAGSTYVGALEKRQQALTQAAAHRLGIPTPEVRWILDAQDAMGEGYVSRRVAGETLGKRIVGDAAYEGARAAMPAQCGVILAAIHALPPSEFDCLARLEPRALITRVARQHRNYGERLPVFELAIRWLEQHVPKPRAPSVLHGDFRTGNFLVSHAGIVGVLDWELAHLGDPMEDLGWLCMNAWRFGQIDRPVGGVGDRASLYRAYESSGGTTVDEPAVRFWETYGTLQWGVVCQYFAFQHLRGEVEALERAAIGRRVSETELDLLNLMDG
jgi:aminoglycoside phosphotransferase (APT) family kinase protein